MSKRAHDDGADDARSSLPRDSSSPLTDSVGAVRPHPDEHARKRVALDVAASSTQQDDASQRSQAKPMMSDDDLLLTTGISSNAAVSALKTKLRAPAAAMAMGASGSTTTPGSVGLAAGSPAAAAAGVARSDSSLALAALTGGWKRTKSQPASALGTPLALSQNSSAGASPVPTAAPVPMPMDETTQPSTTTTTSSSEANLVKQAAAQPQSNPVATLPTSATAPPATSSSNSSSSSSSASKPVTEAQCNQIAAKLMKAEMMGDADKISKLKLELETARAALAASQHQPTAVFSSVSAPVAHERSSSAPRSESRDQHRDHREHRDHRDHRDSRDHRDHRDSRDRRDSHGRDQREESRHDRHDRHDRRDRDRNHHASSSAPDEVEVVAGQTDRTGGLRPLPSSFGSDIRSMAQREKLGAGVEDYDRDFAKNVMKISRGSSGLNSEHDVGDEYVRRHHDDAAAKKSTRHNRPGMTDEDKARNRAVLDHNRHQATLDGCPLCPTSSHYQAHLTIATGINCYLALPASGSLAKGHCVIVPIQHSVSASTFDEEVIDEMQLFRKFVTKMFLAQDLDVVFLETVMHLKRQHHTKVECIPLSRDLGSEAPMYYKKAIVEAESEWQANPKLIETKGRPIRNCLPAGFPYFHVEFGMDFGYAHVVDNELKFRPTFGKEVVGGLLELEPHLWTNPHSEKFPQQKARVDAFRTLWRPFDWTRRLHEQAPASEDAAEQSQQHAAQV